MKVEEGAERKKHVENHEKEENLVVEKQRGKRENPVEEKDKYFLIILVRDNSTIIIICR